MKITIRHAELEDSQALHDIYIQPEVVKGTLQLPFSSISQQRRRIEKDLDSVFVLVAEVDGEIVGHLSLYTFPNSPRRRHAGGLGMAVHDAWQGQGIGSALMQAALDLADNWLGLSRLELEVFVDNDPAVHLYIKSGFEIEGTRPMYALRDGEFADVFVMGRVRSPQNGHAGE
jgi:putative acetyltransferase